MLGIPKLGPRYSLDICMQDIYYLGLLLTVTFIVGRGFNAVGHLEGDYVQFQSHNGLTCATEESGRTDCFYGSGLLDMPQEIWYDLHDLDGDGMITCDGDCDDLIQIHF